MQDTDTREVTVRVAMPRMKGNSTKGYAMYHMHPNDAKIFISCVKAEARINRLRKLKT